MRQHPAGRPQCAGPFASCFRTTLDPPRAHYATPGGFRCAPTQRSRNRQSRVREQAFYALALVRVQPVAAPARIYARDAAQLRGEPSWQHVVHGIRRELARVLAQRAEEPRGHLRLRLLGVKIDRELEFLSRAPAPVRPLARSMQLRGPTSAPAVNSTNPLASLRGLSALKSVTPHSIHRPASRKGQISRVRRPTTAGECGSTPWPRLRAMRRPSSLPPSCGKWGPAQRQYHALGAELARRGSHTPCTLAR